MSLYTPLKAVAANGGAPPDPRRNRLLARLDEAERAEVVRLAQPVSLGLRARLYESGDPIRYVYFPLKGLVSVVAVSRNGDTVEVGPVGCDGVVGLPVYLGGGTDPLEAFVQIPPVEALRLPADLFLAAVGRLPGLDRTMRLYTQWTYYGMAQWVLCARVHPAEERLGRWLLMCSDRVGSDRFPMTHEFLAEMLGVRRASVTIAALGLRRAGLVHYRRGEVTILDREGLEEASCECNRVSAEEYQRLIGAWPRCGG